MATLCFFSVVNCFFKVDTRLTESGRMVRVFPLRAFCRFLNFPRTRSGQNFAPGNEGQHDHDHPGHQSCRKDRAGHEQ